MNSTRCSAFEIKVNKSDSIPLKEICSQLIKQYSVSGPATSLLTC